jgi:RNA polymerase sigma-70 factor (ECF subfamily)
MTDGQLVRDILAGNVGAYDPLVRRWTPRVMAVCHARVRRADAAEDLAQETVLRGLRALHTLSDPDKFGPWLCGIAVRTCLDWLKASARKELTLSALDADSDGSLAGAHRDASADDSARRDELARMVAEVERLPLPYRQVLMQFYYEDCSYKQIASVLKVSPATVNMRLTRARQMLRERLCAAHEER